MFHYDSMQIARMENIFIIQEQWKNLLVPRILDFKIISFCTNDKVIFAFKTNKRPEGIDI